MSFLQARHQHKALGTYHLTLKFILQDGCCYLQTLDEETGSEMLGNFHKATQPGR